MTQGVAPIRRLSKLDLTGEPLGTLLETLDLARMRMLGPHDLGPANHFLPATLLAFNPAGDTVSTDLVSRQES